MRKQGDSRVTCQLGTRGMCRQQASLVPCALRWDLPRPDTGAPRPPRRDPLGDLLSSWDPLTRPPTPPAHCALRWDLPLTGHRGACAPVPHSPRPLHGALRAATTLPFHPPDPVLFKRASLAAWGVHLRTQAGRRSNSAACAASHLQRDEQAGCWTAPCTVTP